MLSMHFKAEKATRSLLDKSRITLSRAITYFGLEEVLWFYHYAYGNANSSLWSFVKVWLTAMFPEPKADRCLGWPSVTIANDNSL